MKARTISAFAVLVLSIVGTAGAQDALSQAKTLYAAANYEEALKLLDSSDGGTSTPEVSQYRALCLLALGRTADAEREAAAVIAIDPFFMPDEDDVAPRVVNLFTDVRRQLLPSIIRLRFDGAKRLFSAGNRDQARREFQSVVRLLDDPVLTTNGVLTDLKIVAQGFVDLAASTPAAPAVPPPPSSPAPAAQPASEAAPAAASRKVVVVPAATIQQTLPSWQPRDPFSRGREFDGAVRVLIDENGRVISATIERSIHREYDPLLLESTQRWRYKPATRDGVQIRSEKLVEVRVRTR
jgi:TonB family protein